MFYCAEQYSSGENNDTYEKYPYEKSSYLSIFHSVSTLIKANSRNEIVLYLN